MNIGSSVPELPEVEIMTRKLCSWTEKLPYLDTFRVFRQNGRYFVDGLPSDSYICRIYRIGKMIVFDLTTGTIVCHNAMSGYWDAADDRWTFDYVEGKRNPTDSDIRVVLTITQSDKLRSRDLLFHDTRLFGSLRFFHEKDITKIQPLRVGPDALEIDLEHFKRILQSKRNVKEVLMDQKSVSGIGNIYSSEALWYAQLRPDRRASDISSDESLRLWLCIRSVLEMALERKLDYSGLKIYRRKICSVCSEQIRKIKIAERSTYYCERCQT